MSVINYSTTRTKILSFFSMLLGAFLMVVLVLSFNKPVAKKEEAPKKESRFVKMASTPPPVAPKPKPKPKPKTQTPKAPLPNLDSLLGGIEMNIPEFATDDIAGDGSDVLGDMARDAAMNEGSVDSKPRVASRSPMEYPDDAMKKRIKGYVIVNLLIAADGSVEAAQVLESSPSGVFDAVAVNGVRNWRFIPAKYKGNPVKVWAKQKIRFDFN